MLDFVSWLIDELETTLAKYLRLVRQFVLQFLSLRALAWILVDGGRRRSGGGF